MVLWPLYIPDRLKKKAFLAVAGVFVVSSMIAWSVFMRPLLREWAALRDAKKIEIKKKGILQGIVASQKKINRLEGSMAKQADTTSLIGQLNDFAKASGVALISAVPQGLQKTEDYEKITLHIEAVCSYHDLGDFVSSIENASPFVKISNVHIEMPASAQETGGLLRVQMSLSTFHKSGAA